MVLEVLYSIALYIAYLIFTWIRILWTSISNTTIIWVTFPLYLTWIATELFQEKKETSYGNAATNGVITSYVSLDWIRQMYIKNIGFSFVKLILAIILIIYGIYVVIVSIRKKPVARILGRIKYISYFQIMLTVLVYSEYTKIPLNIDSILAIIIGFPIIWFVTRMADRYLPDITTEKEESDLIEYGSDSDYWSSGYRKEYFS